VAGGWRRLPAHASCGADEPLVQAESLISPLWILYSR
jgi:hypothetical protein